MIEYVRCGIKRLHQSKLHRNLRDGMIPLGIVQLGLEHIQQ